jgi:hypothetical protein
MNVPEKAGSEDSPERRPFTEALGSLLLVVGGVITSGFGTLTVLYLVSRIGGDKPSPNVLGFEIAWLIFGCLPFALGVALVGSPAANRFWRRVLVGVFLLAAVAAMDGKFGPTNWQRVFSGVRLPGADAAKLQRTIVSPHLEVPMTPGKNVLWCGTFQLAWNELCGSTGGDLKFDSDDPMIGALNKHGFTKESLDDASYVALAGFVRDGIHEEIPKVIEEKFHGAFKPRLLPDPKLTPRPQDIVAYACLYKHLSFPVAFERLDDGLTFGGEQAPAFGFRTFKPEREKAYEQVSILDYQNENDFVIELKTSSEGDRLILAKVQPKQTLAETVGSVQARVESVQAQEGTTNDVLVVPKLDFDVTREYSEIERKHLVSTNANVAKDLVVRSALQNTKFEMNEKGVELRSEAEMSIGCAQHVSPPITHRMIFDRPFLIMMERTKAAVPYFALWVDNPEMLVAWK